MIYLTLFGFAATLDPVLLFEPATFDPVLLFEPATFDPVLVFDAAVNLAIVLKATLN